MPEHNRQTNAHLVGAPAEGVVQRLVAKLDCNINPTGDLRSRLTWLVWNANLLILLPGWKESSTALTEVALAIELGIRVQALHDILPDEQPYSVFLQDMVDHFRKYGLEVAVIDMDRWRSE